MHDRARSAGASGPTGLFLALLARCLFAASVASRRGPGVTTAGCRDLPPAVVVDIRDARVFQRALALGNLGFGEAYMDGDFIGEQGTLADLLTLLLRNRLDERLRSHPRLALRVLALRARTRLRHLH